jgi:hypothetical protein
VREDVPLLGDLSEDFDFNQPPMPPFQLPTHPAPWAVPAEFRLLLAVPKHESLRAHGGRLLAGATCVTVCQLQIGGYVQLGGRRLGVLPRTLSFSGHRRFALELARGAVARLSARAASRPVLAHLKLLATRPGVPQDTVPASAQIELSR